MKALVYPYSKDEIQLFRYKNLLTGIDPSFAVSPPGWGLAGRDVTEIDGGSPAGITIRTDLKAALEQADCLITPSFMNYYGNHQDFSATITLAEKMGKKVVILDPNLLKEESIKGLDPGSILWKPLNNQEYIENYIPGKFVESYRVSNIGFQESDRLNTPTLIIAGNGPRTSKFELQLLLRTELAKQPLKVVQIGSRPYCEFFGFISFPSFMFDKQLSEVEKIERFRKMILYIQQQEKPDIIIIGIPGGILPINDRLHNEYGLIHLETTLACRADLLLLSLYYDDYFSSSVEFWANYIQGRFNAQLAGIVISKTWMDLNTTLEINELYTCQLEKKPPAIEKDQEESGVFFSLFDSSLGEKLADCVLDKFRQSCIK